MKNFKQYIKESFSGSREVKNSKLRKLLDSSGYKSVHLYKGKGYFYIMADSSDKELEEIVNGMYDPSIYVNSFSQQSPEEWFNDIDRMINKEKNI